VLEFRCGWLGWCPLQPNHTETPTHIETRTHNQCGDTIEKLQASGDGYINVLKPQCFFSGLLAAEVRASAVVMLDTPCSEVECKTAGYAFHSHVYPSLPLSCVIVCHHVATEL